MQDEFDAIVDLVTKEVKESKAEAESRGGRTILDMAGFKLAFDFAQKCKKDGLLEWQRQEWQEAFWSWEQGDDVLRRFRAPPKVAERLLSDLHAAILKNLAQAAIKLERWGEAVDAADRALQISEDHKAWFRKACALEALGRIDEACSCLERIEELAVGRVDRERLCQDVQRRRQRLIRASEKNASFVQRMVQTGLLQGALSAGGDAVKDIANGSPIRPLDLRPNPQRRPGMTTSHVRSRVITKDAAWDLAAELSEVYQDPSFISGVDKLICDVRCDCARFVEHLAGVALVVQKPVLCKWGFTPSLQGCLEMKLALREHVGLSPALQAKLEDLNRALCGSSKFGMFDQIDFFDMTSLH